MHQKRAVGDLNDLDSVNPTLSFNDLQSVFFVAGIDCKVPNDPGSANLNDIDRPDQPAGITNDRRYYSQLPRPIGICQTNRQAV
jgi:hypothetical protein